MIWAGPDEVCAGTVTLGRTEVNVATRPPLIPRRIRVLMQLGTHRPGGTRCKPRTSQTLGVWETRAWAGSGRG